jgi:peptidoglycan/LPS O-acetylase OafA/YrhL
MHDRHSPGEAPRCPPRYASLDVWRGLACLLVVCYHAVYYARLTADSPAEQVAAGVVRAARWGWLGVPLFFVISGYCIAAAVDSARKRRARVPEYFWRRFRRIYPPYWCFLLLTVAAVALTEGLLWPGLLTDNPRHLRHPRDLTAWQWLGDLTLTETWRFHLVGEGRAHFAIHAWSLCYEEQFYAVSGLILLLAPRRLFPVIGLLSVGILGLKHVSGWLAFDGALRGFFFDGRWLVFAAGALVYYQLSQGSRRVTFWARLTLLLGVAYTLRKPSDIDYNELCGFGFALLISLLHPLDRRIAALPPLRPLAFCGAMCYSVYLVHYPLVKALGHGLSLAGADGPLATVVLTLPVCLAVSLAAAFVFHRLVERRFLNAPRQTGQPASVNAPPLLQQGEPLAA